MIIRPIEFGSEDYRKECELRNKVLRIPLGLNLFEEDLSCEIQQVHFGMFDRIRNLVACAIVVTHSSTESQIRQMAVGSQHRAKGHGRRLVNSIENYLVRQGVIHLFMHARMAAIGFYEKLGYTRVGQEFIEVGIPHVRMEKSFNQQDKLR